MIKTYQVEKDNYQDAGKASSDIKRTLKALGIDRKILKAVAIACYEAEINIAIHSDGGTVTFEIDDDGIVHLAFDDIGPGIEDLNPVSYTHLYPSIRFFNNHFFDHFMAVANYY